MVRRAPDYHRTTGTGTITLNGAGSGTTTYGISTSTLPVPILSRRVAWSCFNSTQDISLVKTNINFTGSNAPSVTLDTNYTSATPANGAIVLTNSKHH